MSTQIDSIGLAFALECRHVTKRFATKTVVDDVSLTVRSGHILTLVGPSGCGKTTTLRLIAGFETPDSGSIEIAGQLVASEAGQVPPEKRRTGMVFQDYALFPHLSVAQNVGFVLGRGQATQDRVADLLAFVGLPGFGDKMPHQLSGGEQQRVSLARALSIDPAVLLLDEPFSNLDAALRVAVRAEVRDILKQRAITAVFVTHDQEEALFLGDEVAVMMDGRVEQIGTPETVYHRPRTRRVAEFIGQTSFVSGEVTGRGVITSLGILPQPAALAAGTVDVAVRPDDVGLRADENGNGWIVSRQFVGIAYLYQVQLADGTQLICWQPHTMDLADGTRVSVTLTPGHDLAIFAGGEAV